MAYCVPILSSRNKYLLKEEKAERERYLTHNKIKKLNLIAIFKRRIQNNQKLKM